MKLLRIIKRDWKEYLVILVIIGCTLLGLGFAVLQIKTIYVVLFGG